MIGMKDLWQIGLWLTEGLTLCAALLVSGCSSDSLSISGDIVGTEGRIPLSVLLTAPVNDGRAATRTNGLADGEGFQNRGALDASNATKVGLFVLKKSGKTVTDASWERMNQCSATLTNNGGYSQYGAADGAALYYPEDRAQEVDVYAYVPYTATMSMEGTQPVTDITNNINIAIPIDQTTLNSYRAADILWGCAGTGTYVASSVAADGAYGKLGYGASGTGQVSQDNNREVSVAKHLELQGDNTKTGRVGGTAYYKAGVAATPQVVVPMLHRCAKIVVRLTTDGMALDKLQNATVRTLVHYQAVQLFVSNGSLTSYSMPTTDGPDCKSWAARPGYTGDAQTTRAWCYNLSTRLGLSGVTTGGEKVTAVSGSGAVLEGVLDASGNPVTAVGDAKYYSCAAIVAPQKSPDVNGFNLFEIDLYDKTSAHTAASGTNPVTATYGWRAAAPITFESGKVYTFDVVVAPTQMDVALTVHDWQTGEVTGTYSLDGGETTISNAKPTAQMETGGRTPVVGDLYFSDGSWGTLSDNTSGQQKTASDAIGIVFQNWTSDADQALGYRNGYVMSLRKPTASLTTWCQDTGGLRTENVTGSTTLYDAPWTGEVNGSEAVACAANTLAAIRADLDGLSHCLAARRYCEEQGIAFSSLSAIHTAVVKYASQVKAPTVSSGWYLPSIGQMYAFFKAAWPTQLTGTETWNAYVSQSNESLFLRGSAASEYTSEMYEATIKEWLNNHGLEGCYDEGYGIKDIFTSSECTNTKTGQIVNSVISSHGNSIGYYYRRNGKGAGSYDIRPVLAF